jgi:hypothetical protein
MNWIQKMSQQKVLVITRGPSGSGKSTMVEQLSSELNAPVFSSDNFFMINGKYQYEPNLIGRAHAWNEREVEKAMMKGVPALILDNTNTALWMMKNYVVLAQKHGYQVTFKEPDWDPGLKDESGHWNVDFLERMQKSPDRVKINKGVPREVLEKMVNEYDYNPTVEQILSSERPVMASRK